MKNFYTFKSLLVSFCTYLILGWGTMNVQAQNFSQNSLKFNKKGSITNGTSLQFGPDGRLYVTEYTGLIKIFTIQRNGPGDYIVLDMEVIAGLQSIQDYNDDGSLFSSTYRETIGLAVAGTASNPVIYVTSSDFRIGGGGGGGNGDVGLDTNSGIITRYTWNGTTWDEVDLVRGLPRSEENHATNGLEVVKINGSEYLIVAQGGHTNAGSPSQNFAYTTEYALSAAILSVNLSMLNTMPVKDDNGRKYIYDLPTLDDPTRTNVNGIIDPNAPGYDGIDVNDPFGGNDGLNQAIIVPGGPVQIFSPGYRNAYDLVVTEGGAVFVTDNGANGGWGGFPVNEGGGLANNDYDSNEPGSSTYSEGEKANNKDHLSLVTLDIQNYTFGSFYGGHPTPVRANPNGAGLYTNPSVTGTSGAVLRTKIYHPTRSDGNYTTNPAIGLPANWPPVPFANSVEGDWRGPEMDNPDGPNDALVTVWGTNTNGIDEYTASNFNNAMKGNLIAGVNTGELRRVELNPDGSLKTLTPSFASGLGGDALGVTCNSDSDPFPGTIWVVTLNGYLLVLEPQDFGICLQPGDAGYDPLVDNDSDGYSNQDELDNGSDICNGGSQPADFDKLAGGDLLSDLNDIDDDNDGIPDANDPFQLGDPQQTGSDAFTIPVTNELFSSNPNLKGYLGLGLTGLMNNGDPNPNWLHWIDRRDDPNDPNPNDILGGAIGAMTMHMTSGTALGSVNNQEKGFQYGVQVNSSTGKFLVAGSLANFRAPLQLYGNTQAPNGELGIVIGDGTQSNYIKFVLTPTGLLAQQEISDTPQSPVQLNISAAERPDSGLTLFFAIDPTNGEIILEFAKDAGLRKYLGTITAQGAVLEALQNPARDLAVGLIGTSNATGVEVEGTWDYLNVTTGQPTIAKNLPDLERFTGSMDEHFDLTEYFYDDDGAEHLLYSVKENSSPAIGASITGKILSLTFPSTPAEAEITIVARDSDLFFVEQTFSVSVKDISAVLYRINCGGPAITAIDGEIDWGADTSIQNSPYLVEPGRNKTAGYTMNSYSTGIDLSTTPVSIYNSERYDSKAGAPNVTYSFPVDEPGTYEIRLYFGNGYHGTAESGQRIFDVAVEGNVASEFNDIDLSGTFGHQVGGIITRFVEVSDGAIDISFLHVVENPVINGIEILGSTSGGELPIIVAQIEDQINTIGDDLTDNLVVTASGGEGELSFSMAGAPPGVAIDPISGRIHGTIGAEASIENPYEVIVTVDDRDEHATDAVQTIFTWTITAGGPTIVQDLPDLHRAIDATNEQILLAEYFYDDQGVENLTFTIENNSSTAIGATITDDILTLTFPSVASVSSITIRATDANGNYVEQSFNVTVTENIASNVLYRVNSGGPLIPSIDGEIDWSADTSTEMSPYLTEAGRNKVAGYMMGSYTNEVDRTTTPLTIFESERYDSKAGAPNMTYSFPVTEEGIYQIRLYFGNGYSGTSAAGQRVFDVTVEGVTYAGLNDIDLSGSYGHQVGAVISQDVNVTDGSIDISFLHVLENPLVNGIEILGSSVGEKPISIATIGTQTNIVGDELDGSLVVSATGGEGNLTYSMSGAPAGVNIEPTNGQIGGQISMEAAAGSPYTVQIKVDDGDEDSNDAVTTGFTWIITSEETRQLWASKNENEAYTPRHECSFVQAGNEFFLMGGRENAKTVDIYNYASNSWTSLVDSAPFEFNHFQATEYEGLIWIIGAFQDNLYPVETPAEFIWAFDPVARKWLKGPAIPENRRRGAAGLVIYQDNFYIIGGNTKGHDGGFVAWFDKYDPAKGEWTTLTNAPRARDHFHSAVIGNKLYAVGGRLSGGSGGTFKPVIAEVDVYDFSTQSWSTLPANQNLPTPRGGASTVNFDEKLLVIGGEVSNEVVYGTTISDALKITEQYDPVTGVWTRLADLNFERHGTQAIVSGEGIFTLAGSPNVGGGSQKNMEFLGKDAPAGSPGVQSVVSVPERVIFNDGMPKDIQIDVRDGNVGVYIRSMELTGTGAAAYSITSGEIQQALLKANTIHTLTVESSGNSEASLVIHYGIDEQVVISLESSGTGIYVESIPDQVDIVGDQLDGSLTISASGGEGDLQYTMTGAPQGVLIDADTGVITGTIAMGAEDLSPYTVTITVDDSDDIIDDAAETSFTWTIASGVPVIVQTLPDLERTTGAAHEYFDLSHYFSDEQPGSLIYSIEENSGILIEAQIAENMLTLIYPLIPDVADIKIRATDITGLFAEQTFRVTVNEPSASAVIYRVNSGGPAIQSIDGEMDWAGDTSSQISPYLTVTGGNKVSGYTMIGYTAEVDISTTPLSIFSSERYSKSSSTGMVYSFPVNTPGTYEIRLYLGNGFSGTSSAGSRVFDVAVEGTVYSQFDNIDPSGTYGHLTGAVITQAVDVMDGTLDIHFIHGVENPLINGIEILSRTGDAPAVTIETQIEPEVQVIEEESQLIGASIYPNPASYDAFIKIYNVSIEVEEIQIYSYDGRMVKAYRASQVNEGPGLYKFNVSGLPEGTYIVLVSTTSNVLAPLRLVVKKSY